MVSTVTTNLAEAPLVTADLHLDAFRECNAGDAIFCIKLHAATDGFAKPVQQAVGGRGSSWETISYRILPKAVDSGSGELARLGILHEATSS